MSQDEDVSGWEGGRRPDGMAVVKGLDTWVVSPPDGRPSIVHCPCCGQGFATARRAKLVADAVYPSSGRVRMVG